MTDRDDVDRQPTGDDPSSPRRPETEVPSLHEAIATVICPRYPLGIDGLDFGDGSPRLLPGGFCCFAVDLPESLDAIAELRSKGDSVFPYIASDLERGAGQQIRGLSRLPPALALGAADDEALCIAAGELTAREARAVGISIVFAPVADVATDPRNPIVAIRAFSDSPDDVARLSAAFARGVEQGGAIATAKHYPGHGPTSVDSHLVLPTLEASETELDSVHELPFRHLIDRNVGAIMVGHLHVASQDSEQIPATLSQAVTGRLREKLGYKGLVITDALDMGAIPEGQSPEEEPAVRCILAGADIALLPRDPSKAAQNLMAAVRSGHLPKSRLYEAAERIRTSVRKVDISSTPDATPRPEGASLAEQIAAASVTHDPSTPEPTPLSGRRVRLTMIDDGDGAAREPRLIEALTNHGVSFDTQPADGSTIHLIVVFSQVRHEKGRIVLDPPRRQALEEAIQQDIEQVTILASVGCPQALLEVDRPISTLFTFDDDDASLHALANVLAGSHKALGRMCFQARIA